MQIVRDLAGFTMGRSDLLRRAMSKKKLSVMEKERQNFVYGNQKEGIYGCLSKGISEEVANRIYDKMIDFANYAFNKSHAVSYALLSYQTAFLKCYYAPEFYAATMSSFMDNSVKTAEYIEVAREEGIPILAPDINEAEVGFSVKGKEIRYGLSAVKGVGRSAAEVILDERKKGQFKDFEDFVLRMSQRRLNRRAMESFIYAGALDSLEGNRREKILMLSEVLEKAQKGKQNTIPGQMSLMDLFGEDAVEKTEFALRFPDLPEFPKAELLRNEKDALGVYLSGHPLDGDKNLLKALCTRKMRDFSEEAQEMQKEEGVKDDELCIVGGILTGINKRITKKNDMMAFLTLEDNSGAVEVVAFPKVFESAKEFLEEDRKLFVKGRIQKKDEGEAKLIAERIIAFENLPKEIWIQFANKKAYEEKEEELRHILKERPGDTEVILFLKEEKAVKHLPREFSIRMDERTKEDLELFFGKENIKEKAKSLKFL
jgi:DNA-directed DNA polymerase